METFKLSVLWNIWNPQIQTRVLRDIMALQNLASKSRVAMMVACDQNIRANVEALGVKATDDFTNPDMCRVYVGEGTSIPPELFSRLPDNVDPEVVSLTGDAVVPNGPVVDEAPYAGRHFFKDWKGIPETMPLDKPKPWIKDTDPAYSPYL